MRKSAGVKYLSCIDLIPMDIRRLDGALLIYHVECRRPFNQELEPDKSSAKKLEQIVLHVYEQCPPA